ncbi:MAG: heavy metal translocating P-type ATPase [Hoeflea sp.]|uniref:heavy metal translocating P-type ATPase n=1 Tax=Hoeflea sp. TaxID=1940281 RepID=UPI001D8DDD34|nr:heavy metal translocating P-type ATPase [Hoeflea sp.]MBU4527321.1 heavy metal translocating P-type ATPase [Alphaproteobacteria bacterium]MBU4546896.1 heavy metal translocating P-type ATPase [Alphaproteobacteria bacterium]MBU4551592.1 heavy metal translocating P-type ATPase [Alphaproteobacteria bacterium]MBV1725597.1 heavy metal translocating P-type ATPase [Hoeflea sp.]MBV1759645.1 heavy metal translocating P-type ATPase [Hoeflea sp.]
MTAKPAHVTFDITGMTCASCSARIEKVLSRQPGVSDARVNLALERADIDGDSLDPATLADAIARAGFGAVLRRDDFAAHREADEAQAASRRAEERQTLVRLVISAALTLPIVIGMLPMMTGLGEAWISPLWQAVLATGVMAVSGSRFWREATGALRGGSANMAVLVSLGTGVAYLWSMWVMLSGWADPHAGHGSDMASHLHFEAAAVVLTLIMLGKYLETRAKSGAAGALRALGRLQPDTAEQKTADGAVRTIPVEQLVAGDTILIRPGARVAADGVILTGQSSLDEAMVTGESMLVARGPGDLVITGTTNTDGVLEVEVRAVGADTRLARMTRLVEEAQSGHAPVQKLVDRISAVFVPVILVIALATLAGWMLAGSDFETAMVASVAVLVIACPCALGLATPTALVAGTGAAAKAGILIRDIETLERATDIRAIAFDKTGTLTMGAPEVSWLYPVGGVSDTDLLRLAAALETASEHPLGRAIVSRAQADGVRVLPATAIRAIPGRGLEGMHEGATLRVGSERFLIEAGIDTSRAGAVTAPEGSGTLAWVAADDRLLGVIGLADQIRPHASQALADLSARGLATIMLTGDNEAAARTIAREANVSDVRAGLLPGEKLDAIRELAKSTGGHVAFVGDGLNDAPALAAANLGIAMAGGADAAREAAAITLMRPDLRLVAAALDVAAKTRRTIRQNLGWAFVYNLIGIPLAAFGILPPVFAGAAMAFSSVSVVTNSALMARWKPNFPKD